MKRDIGVVLLLLVLVIMVGFSVLSADIGVPIVRLPAIERFYVEILNEEYNRRVVEMYERVKQNTCKEIDNADQR